MELLSCATCTTSQAVVRAEVRRNERRLLRGQPPVMDGIEAERARQKECALRGHRDPKAGANARWHPDRSHLENLESS